MNMKKDENLTHMVSESIVKMIGDHKIAFGEKINKSVIAEALNVSMTPVNEAINRLTGQGIFEHRKNLGYFLKELTLKDLEDFYYVRAGLQGVAVYNYIKRRFNPNDEFLKIFDRFKDGIPHGAEQEYMQADIAFHMEIINHCGNPVLVKLYEDSNLPYNSYVRGLLRDPAETLHEHFMIIKAIKEQKAYFAQQLMVQHQMNVAENIEDVRKDQKAEQFWADVRKYNIGDVDR